MINTKTLRTGLAAILGMAVLLAGLVAGASIARADDNGQDRTVQEGTLQDLADRVRSRVTEVCGRVGDVTDELGLDLDQIQQRLREGATLHELADEAGFDLDMILEGVRERVLDEIEARTEDGTLSEERGDRIRERIESFDLDQLPKPGDLGFGNWDSGDFEWQVPRGRQDWLSDLGLDLDIDLGELRDRLESGMTLEDALGDLGVDLDTVTEEARQAALEKIDELVADGTLTEEHATHLKEMVENFSFDGAMPFAREFRFNFDGFCEDWGHSHGRSGDGFGYPNAGSEDSINGEGVRLDI